MVFPCKYRSVNIVLDHSSETVCVSSKVYLLHAMQLTLEYHPDHTNVTILFARQIDVMELVHICHI